VRLHGLASSPTPDTQVRVAWAFAKEQIPSVKTMTAEGVNRKRALLIFYLLRFRTDDVEKRKARAVRGLGARP